MKTSCYNIFFSLVLVIGFILPKNNVYGQDKISSSQDKNTRENRIKLEPQYEDTESRMGTQFFKRTEKAPREPWVEALHEARRNGDEKLMREIEKQHRPKIQPNGDSKGTATTRISSTVGHPGERGQLTESEFNQQLNSSAWGTDIHVRGVNTNFLESYSSMATASDGTIYIVWENVGSTNPHNYLQVYYSTDGGSSWTPYGWFANPSFDLAQPSLAIGEGGQDLLVIAYVVQDAVPYIEVMTSPLASGTGWSPTYNIPAYFSFWQGYTKPNVWTDSYDWSSWYIYLTAEGSFDAAANNYDVVFWRSTDYGTSFDDPAQAIYGDLDTDGWRDPDGTYGGFNNELTVAVFNSSNNYLYGIQSNDYGATWGTQFQINLISPVPSHSVDPDIEAAANLDNIMLCCTKSFNSADNIGQCYSTDGGATWTTLYSLDGYTSEYEFAAELTANEGGNSWHVTYTSQSWWVYYSTRSQDLSVLWQPIPDVVNDNAWASASHTKKGITSNWTTDVAGISWSDYRDGIAGDYDIYFDKNEVVDQLYQGPAAGSITGGAFQTTDSFTDSPESKIGIRKEKGKIIPYRETPLAPIPPNMKLPTGPKGSNEVDDISTTESAPILFNDFIGIPDDQNSAGYSFIPPDPICAAGPDHIMACVNNDFAIFDKSGNKLKEIDATLWFENVLSGLDPGYSEPFGVAFDPQIVYDHFAGRWIMTYIAYDQVSNNQSYLLVSTSDDSNPLGTWCNFAIPGNANGSTSNLNLNDYPKLGIDNDAFYVTANMFNMSTWSFEYVQVRIFEKQQFYNNTCGAISWTDFWDLRDPDNLSQKLNTASTVVPAVTFGNPGVEYLINASPYTTGTFMTLWTIFNPIGTPSMTAVNIPVTSYDWPPDADQLGGGTPLIDVGGWRLRNAVYRDGHLVTAHSIADGTGSFARTHYFEVDVSGPTVITDVSYGAPDFWYYYPAITLDPAGNSISVFNRSGTSEYAGIRYNGIEAGAVSGSANLKSGDNNYIKTFGGSRNRWGDYNGIAVDPVNPNTIWTFAEYAASPANTWGTWWGELSYTPLSVPQNLVAMDGYHESVPVYWDPPPGYSPLKESNISQIAGKSPVMAKEKSSVEKYNKDFGSGNGTAQILLSYNLYRSTTPGGPYSLIANIDRQYYRDLAVSNGTTYYYIVEAVYDAGSSDPSNEDGATPVVDGYILQSNYTLSPPVIDGNINPAEWADAIVIDITMPPSTNPVLLYIMNDGNYLYYAVDDQNNLVADDYDQIGIYFDEDHNFEWPPTSPSGEGNFWIEWLTSASQSEYRGLSGWWPNNLNADPSIIPASGVTHDISYTSGHSQYEVAINLSSSELNVAPGDDFGFYTYAFEGLSFTFNGFWPGDTNFGLGGLGIAPFAYGTLVLASSAPPGPIVFDSYLVDDDNTNNSIGNGDGVINPGETIELYVYLHNLGIGTAVAVNGAISDDSPYTTYILNTSSGYGDIPGSGIAANTNDFDIQVDPSTPDGHLINFTLDITAANGGPWTVNFSIPVKALPPDIDVNPLSFTFNVAPESTDSDILTISNTAAAGSQGLSYYIFDNDVILKLNDGRELPVRLEPSKVDITKVKIKKGNISGNKENVKFRSSFYPEDESVSLTDHLLSLHAIELSNSTSSKATVKLDQNYIPTVDYLSGILYDNGPLVNSPGTGVGGANESVLQTLSLGMNTLGWGHQVYAGNRIADDFTVTDPSGWIIDAFKFYAFQANSTTSSPITAVNYRIWDGPPDNPASTIIYGDSLTNRLLTTEWSNIYRVDETTSGTSIIYPIMENTVSAGVYLPPGTYWLDWQSDGISTFSGPWAPPITVNGQTVTGNALQWLPSAWGPVMDLGQQGFPFQITGTAGSDCPWLSTSPDAGVIPPGSNQLVDIVVDATGLLAGTYNCNLIIVSNDPDENPIEIPVTMNVIGAGIDWAANLMVEDNCVNFQGLTFGTASDATNGFDPLYDQYAPPPPPSGAFDARFSIGSEDYLKDFRATISGVSIVWDVYYQEATGCSPVTLSWNPSELPSEGFFRLVDTFTGGSLVNVDMRNQSSYADNLALGHLQIIYSLSATFNKDILAGWNLLGLPLEVEDAYYLTLFPNSIPGTLFGFNGSYYATDSLEICTGYWLRFPGPEIVPIVGTPIPPQPVSLISGWNIISGLSCDIALSDVGDPGSIIIPGTLFGFNGAYFAADTIKQGMGYWIRTSSAGTINLNCTTILAKSGTYLSGMITDVSQFSSIEISDASGAAQSLYFNGKLNKQIPSESYSLPPVPPAGSFDARLSGDYRITNSDEVVLLVQSSKYPLSIKVNGLNAIEGMRYAIKEVIGGKEVNEHPISAGENIVITNQNVKMLKISKVSLIPLTFDLYQNYPNPFNPSTHIKYSLPEKNNVEVIIYNALGQLVKRLVSEFQEAGYYTVEWNGTDDGGQKVGSGVYFYAIRAGDNYAVKKMILLK